MKPIIEAENLTKVYRIVHSQDTYYTLRDRLKNFFKRKSLFTKDYINALDRVSFSIEVGDKIGIIGKNGAGKTTLLKILSRITPPTEGKAILRGKVASLLEVGIGFHGELTGRENIFFNGAILGMKRYEIRKKLDEIVEFSGVEKFLDTPLKHYSSGMQVRLAFAVAAHLDADILLIDEVLAVGDAEFQKKSLGKMDEISKSGKTILFVSHNMNAISQLCNKCFLLDKGKLVYADDTQKVIKKYLNDETYSNTSKYWNLSGNGIVRPISIRILNNSFKEQFKFKVNEEILFEIVYENLSTDELSYPNIHIYNSKNQCVLASMVSEEKLPKNKGTHKVIGKLEKNLLNQDTYYVGLFFTTIKNYRVDFADGVCVSFEVEDIPEERNYPFYYPMPGIIRRELEWM